MNNSTMDDDSPSFSEQNESNTKQTENELPTGCISCSRKEVLKTFDDLKAGSHVTFPGKIKVNCKGNQFRLYTHHAILEKFNVVNPSEADLTLIHYCPSSLCGISLQKLPSGKNSMRYNLRKDKSY